MPFLKGCPECRGPQQRYQKESELIVRNTQKLTTFFIIECRDCGLQARGRTANQAETRWNDRKQLTYPNCNCYDT